MAPRNRARFFLALVGTAALVACSPETAVAPAAASGIAPSAARGARGSQIVVGTYVLSFVDNHLQPVTTLVVGGPELILAAHVADAAGTPARRGSVSFQYCSLNGLPSNDITRPDEAPSADCASGAATWTQLTSVRVDASGNAYMDFGVVMIPRTVGFRFRYLSQGSSIPNGTSAPADFTWISGT